MSPARVVIAAAVLFAVEIPAQAANRTLVHTVEKGDTLWALSKRTGCTVEQLREANPDADMLRPGDRLELPVCAEIPESAVAAKPLPGARHVVERGDTVARIARRYGVSEDAIRTLNDLGDRSMIIVGQSLALPNKLPPPPPKIRVVAGQSVGRPDRGKLIGGVQLPHHAAYHRRHPAKAYGAQHAIDHTLAAIGAVRAKHPRVHKLAIGDLSKERGGPISGHRSHQSGRDVDLGLYYRRVPSEYPDEFVKASQARVDVAATWTLIESLSAAARKPGGPEYIFLDYGLQKQLYEHAREQGMSKAKLEEIFQYPHGRHHRGGLVRHEPNHADHLHVRFSCPPKDGKCK
jgi:LysM repeat protein